MTIAADCVVCTCLEAQGAPELARPKNLDIILILNVLLLANFKLNETLHYQRPFLSSLSSL